jgi:hypothetical protein
VYKGLFDTKQGLSESDARAVGFMTLNLVLLWERWVHRRVERISFCDDDSAKRDVSVDFTLPHWFHEIRGTPAAGEGEKRQLVPLMFLQKTVLVNFSLRNESDTSLPMLTATQHSQVAKEALTVLASLALKVPDVPAEIEKDIFSLVSQGPAAAEVAYQELYGRDDAHVAARRELQQDEAFDALATSFVRNFLALTMMRLGRHDRRVIHLAYEDPLQQSDDIASTVRRFRSIARGEERTVMFTSPSVAEADSYHMEITAPESLQISGHEEYLRGRDGTVGDPRRRPGSHQRVHAHFTQAPSGSQAVVVIRLVPRLTTLVRFATLASVLCVLAIVTVAFTVGSIHQGSKSSETAAAVLLSFTALIGASASLEGDSPIVRGLLWPVQLIALAPVLWTFLATLAVVAPLSGNHAQIFLAFTGAMALLTTASLSSTWRNLARLEAQGGPA